MAGGDELVELVGLAIVVCRSEFPLKEFRGLFFSLEKMSGISIDKKILNGVCDSP